MFLHQFLHMVWKEGPACRGDSNRLTKMSSVQCGFTRPELLAEDRARRDEGNPTEAWGGLFFQRKNDGENKPKPNSIPAHFHPVLEIDLSVTLNSGVILPREDDHIRCRKSAKTIDEHPIGFFIVGSLFLQGRPQSPCSSLPVPSSSASRR